MHAVVVTVRIEPGHEQEAIEQLHARVVPTVQQTPGAVAGYWLSAKEGRGLSVVVFESEEAAQAQAERVPNMPRSEFVTFENIEVREVVANF